MIIMVSVIQEKSWDLSFIMEMLTEAREMNDDIQVKKIAIRGIKEAERQGETQWKSKFQEYLNEDIKNTSFELLEEEEIESTRSTPDLSQVKGIGASVDAKLRSSGFRTIEMLASSTPEQLAQVPGIGMASAEKIIENAREYLRNASSIPPKNELKASPAIGVTPYQKLLARAKEIQIEKSESQIPSPKMERSKVIQQNIEPTISDGTKKPDSTQILTPHCQESSLTPEVEEFEESKDKFEEIFEESTEYKPIRQSFFTSREQFLTEDESELPCESRSQESPNQAENIPTKINSTPIRREVPKISTSTNILKTSKIPHREARMNSLPNGKQLLQRQKSAQKILQVIRDLGMIEIPMNKPELQNVFQAVDLLACKPMRGENGRCIILLVPIKHLSTSDPVYVWDSHVMTGTLDDEPTTSVNMAINTHVKKLVNASEYLFSEITNGKSLISLISRFIGISIKADLTFRNKQLYIGSKEIEFQVILDPVLLSDTSVYCLEKTLPYAYQQGSNLHVVSFEQLDELLEFLQLKYRLLNRHDTSNNAIMKTDEVKTSTFKQLQLFSLPFLGYGLLFTFFLLLGIHQAIRFFISLGYGLIFVYGGFIVFILFRHLISMKRIESNFSVPYHQRNINLSQEDFILINEQLSPDWMVQFSHEIEGTQIIPKQKRVQTKFVGDDTYNPQSSNQLSFNAKYRNFLDD